MVWRESTLVIEIRLPKQKPVDFKMEAADRDVRLNKFFEDKWEALPTGKAVRSCKDNK